MPSNLRRWLGTHWRGGLPLAPSFWLANVLPMLLGSLVLGALVALLSLGIALRAGSIALLIGWALLLAWSVWALVGSWRSATIQRGRAEATARERGVAWAAQGALVALALALLAALLLNLSPHARRYFHWAHGVDPGGHLALDVSPDGRRLRLQGPLGLNDAARLQQVLEGAPAVRLVELASPGGSLGEAQGAAALLRARRLTVRAVGDCDNGCVLLLLAGAIRQLAPDARLGLQRLAVASFNPLFGVLVNRELAARYRQAGLPEPLVGKMLSTPPAWLWRPGRDELAAGGVISQPQRPLDIELPAADGAQALDYADALHTHPTWHALDRRFPGSIAAAAGQMYQARSAGASDDAVQLGGQRVVESLLPRLLARASPALREQFVVLLGEQLGELKGAGNESCRGLLAGDAAVRRALSPTPARREAAWLEDAAAEQPPEAPARPPTALEVEVVRRTLGERAPALLATLWRPAPAAALDCARASALVDALLAMPAPERRLAIKLVFARPA